MLLYTFIHKINYDILIYLIIEWEDRPKQTFKLPIEFSVESSNNLTIKALSNTLIGKKLRII